MISFHTPHPVLKRARRGLTLVEILIALTMTLIVLGAMMSAFGYASAEMQNGRAMLEMANRVRVAENLLRRDLANLTVEPRPYIGKVIPNGYFEYIEGPRRDLKAPFTEGVGSNMPATIQPNSYLGDSDDILAMTCRSVAGSVFRGRLFGATDPIESAYAEIIWWTFLNDSNNDLIIDYSESQDLFRRVLIINPDLNAPIPGAPGEVAIVNDIPFGQALEWLALSDVSVHFEPAAIPSATGNVDIVANSLQDLADRRNRAFRSSTIPTYPFSSLTFPHPLNRTTLSFLRASDSRPATVAGVNDFDGDGTGILQNGNDIVLTDLAAFDVRVFSPDCVLSNTFAGQLLEPSDPGYPNPATGVVIDSDGDGLPSFADDDDGDATNTIIVAGTPRGAFVDLGHHGFGQFSQVFGTTLSLPRGFFSTTGNVAARSPLNYQFFFGQLDFTMTPPEFTDPTASANLTGLLETVYDTWTPTYESDGNNQDNQAFAVPSRVLLSPLNNVADANLIDQGTDGIDNDVANGPDDYNERETQPPYPDPISGLKVTIRMVEKQTGEVRQSSVVHNYGAQ